MVFLSGAAGSFHHRSGGPHPGTGEGTVWPPEDDLRGGQS